jgi:hypothetical protein
MRGALHEWTAWSGPQGSAAPAGECDVQQECRDLAARKETSRDLAKPTPNFIVQDGSQKSMNAGLKLLVLQAELSAIPSRKTRQSKSRRKSAVL